MLAWRASSSLSTPSSSSLFIYKSSNNPHKHIFRPTRSSTTLYFQKRMNSTENWPRNDYKAALEALNTLQSNAAAIAAWKKHCRATNSTTELHEEMLHCSNSIGIDLNWLSSRSIHVAGTKGKGSTSAMSESIIRHHGFKTGLFTSPHLITVRERIKINGEAISEELFVKYFWSTWDLLKASRNDKWPLMPGWFRYLTLLAFKVFQEEKVDCAVIEVGIGGKADSTNILTFPAACGITLLDYDHTEILGNTLPEIASQKAGIFKKNVVAVTVPQQEDAFLTLQQFAHETGNPLYIANHTVEEYVQKTGLVNEDQTLGLTADFLKSNASLAIALSDVWLSKWNTEKASKSIEPKVPTTPAFDVPSYPLFKLNEETVVGLKKFHWPGRAQIYNMPNNSIYSSKIRLLLDGAHTTESVKACTQWFETITDKSSGAYHVLFFNCNKPRDPRQLLAPIVSALATGKIHLDCVYFTMSQIAPKYRKDPSNDIAYNTITQNSWQHEMAAMWQELVQQTKPTEESSIDSEFAESNKSVLLDESIQVEKQTAKVVIWPQVKVIVNVNDGMEEVNDLATSIELAPKKVEVLVTGSLYLVGAMLELLSYPTDK